MGRRDEFAAGRQHVHEWVPAPRYPDGLPSSTMQMCHGCGDSQPTEGLEDYADDRWSD